MDCKVWWQVVGGNLRVVEAWREGIKHARVSRLVVDGYLIVILPLLEEILIPAGYMGLKQKQYE